MDFGSLADWVGGIGGFLAAWAAVVAWRVNRRMLDVEERRDAKAQERRRREQASLVFALGAKLESQEDSDERWGLYFYNGSSKPIYDVTVRSKKIKSELERPALQLAAVPPGQFVIPGHRKYHWGTLQDLSRDGEKVELLLKGEGSKSILEITFRDAAGGFWRLNGGTVLEEIGAAEIPRDD